MIFYVYYCALVYYVYIYSLGQYLSHTVSHKHLLRKSCPVLLHLRLDRVVSSDGHHHEFQDCLQSHLDDYSIMRFLLFWPLKAFNLD